MTLTNSIAAKLVVAAVAIAMAFAFVAPTAKAQDVSSMSLEELIALVNQLQAQLAGGNMSGSCSYTWTRSLSNGSTGADVMNLQSFLNMSADTQVAASGAGSAGQETSYYGPLTAAAVSKFQTKYSADILVPVGLTSPTGYFGPSTMAKANSVCSSMSDDGDMDGGNNGGGSDDLSGGAGSVSEYKKSSEWNVEEVGEEEEDVTVVGLEIEADDNSDLSVLAVKVDFDDEGTANNSADLDKYVEEVTIWHDGDKVAELDASEFDDDNNYGKTITLDETVKIEAGERETLQVAVTGISNLDSGDAGDSWNVDIEQVRWKDAQGTVISEDPTITETKFTVESFATATDVEFQITSGDDDINDTRVLLVGSTTATDNVEVFAFDVEVEGDSDLFVDDLTVEATVTGAGQLDEMADQAHLYMDGDKIDSVTVPTDDETVTFDDLDLDLEAGETYEFIVALDFLAINGALDEGDTVSFTIGETETDLGTAFTDIRDANGDQLADADKNGSASSDAHLAYSIAPSVEITSTSIVANDNGNAPAESATAKIEIKIEALGGTVYLNGDDETTENKQFFVGQVYGSGTTASTTASTTTFTVISGTNDVTNSGADNEYYTLEEGESMTIRVESIVSQSTITTTAVLAGLKAGAIKWGVDFGSDTARSANSFTYTDLLDATQSGTASLVNAS